MHNLIANLLKKRGVEFTQLDNDEKETYDKWQKILTEEEITVDRIKEFCQSQLRVIEEQYTNPDNSPQKDNHFKTCLLVYKAIIGIIDKPKVEKRALIKQLEQMLK